MWWLILLIGCIIADVSVKQPKADAEETNFVQQEGLVDRSQSFKINPEFVAVANFPTMFNSRRKQQDLLGRLDRALEDRYADQSSDRWLEPPQNHLWINLRNFLVDIIIYAPLVGLLAFGYWNRILKKEIRRRQRVESLLKVAVEGAELICWEYFPETETIRAFGKVTEEGWEPISRDLTVEEVFARIHPQDLPRVQTALANCEQFGEINLEHRRLLLNGEEIWVLAIGKLFTDEEQKTKRLVGISFNITNLKETEAQLQHENTFRQKILDQMAEGLCVCQEIEDFPFIYFSVWNRQMEAITGYTQSEINRLGWYQTMYPDPDLREQAIARKKRMLEGDHLLAEEWVICRRDGQQRIVSFSTSALTENNNQPYTIALVQDVTERKEAEIALQKSEQRFQDIADNVPGAIMKYVLRSDGSNGVIYMSPGCYELWEVEASEVIEDASILLTLAHPDDRPVLEASVRESARTLQPWFAEWRITSPSGKQKWLEGAGKPEKQDNGDVVWNTVILDVSDRKRAELALKETSDRLQLITNNMGDFVGLHDAEGYYLYVTPSCEALLGYPPEELIGCHPDQFMHPGDYYEIDPQKKRLSFFSSSPPRVYRFRQKNGTYRWLETLSKPIRDESGQITHWQTASRDVSDRVEMEEQLRYEALHDQLTGLPNRKQLEQRLQQLLNHCQRVPHAQFAVLFLDLDQFKIINDSLGHIAGDQLLFQVAKRFTHLIGKTNFIARLGGDEFVIVLEEIANVESATKLAEKILAGLRSRFKIREREIFIRSSIGIVIGTCRNYQQPEEILRDADTAMYRAKDSGGKGYALFNSQMHCQTLERLHLEHDLHQALEKNQFVLYYQPVVCLETGQVRSFETLIRWQHPEKGLLSPGAFITIAEETQLIIEIGQWVLRSACEQLARWQKQFPDRDLKLAVNLSVQQMQNPLLEQLDELLKTYDLSGESLILEITESMLVENVETTHTFLNQIKAKGIILSIDDFGTGYSSLSYLHQLPIDGLKIDRAFVSPDASDTKHRLIADSIMALCKSLKLRAIAEGIETPEQLQWLHKLGCRLGQGYLFSPPLPSDRAGEIITSTFPTTS